MSLDPTLSTAALAAFETALNGALALDPVTIDRLAALEGKVIAFEVTPPGITVFMAPGANGVRLMGHFGGEPDTTLSGSAFALARLASTPKGTPAPALFSGEVVVRGDVDLGRRVQDIFKRVDLDLEEHLARLTGDVVAHQVGDLVRGLAAWGRRAAENLGRNTADYLQEEALVTPTRGEVEHFAAAVEALREDTDRVAARIRRLRDKLGRSA
ncbi:MAG: SCP2 domain-containing protein [Thiohalomonadaceae bacterium]